MSTGLGDARTGEEIARTVVPPPVPWRMRGEMHMALFACSTPAGEAPPMPAGLRPLLGGHRVVALVRYREGTLRYDELVIGRLARKGVRAGFFVDHIWVDSAESVAGGRLFWGLPKELASFTWSDGTVRVEDHHGLVAVASAREEPAKAPLVPVPAPGFGVRDGQVLYSPGKLKVRLRGTSLRIEAWGPRFGAIALRPQAGFDAAPFELEIGEAVAV